MFCVQCGGGGLRRTADTVCVDWARALAEARRLGVPWELVVGFLANALDVPRIADDGVPWREMAALCNAMAHSSPYSPSPSPSLSPPPSPSLSPNTNSGANASSPVSGASSPTLADVDHLIGVHAILPEAWSNVPLRHSPAFLGGAGWRFFRPDFGGRAILGGALVSDRGNLALSTAQHRLNASLVVGRIDVSTGMPCPPLAPLMMWMLYHGDIALFTQRIAAWLVDSTVTVTATAVTENGGATAAVAENGGATVHIRCEIARRAFDRTAWLALADWLDDLDPDPDRDPWAAIERFLFAAPSSSAPTTAAGETLSPSSEGYSAPGWWTYHLQRVPRDARALSALATGHVHVKGRGRPCTLPPSTRATRHRTLFSALVRAESGDTGDALHDVPDWAASADVPEYPVLEDGAPLCDLLAASGSLTAGDSLTTGDLPTTTDDSPTVGVDNVLPPVPLVPLAHQFCTCFGEHLDEGRHPHPVDAREIRLRLS